MKARLYVLPILVVAPLYNFPRFFEFRLRTRTVYVCEGEEAGAGPEEDGAADYGNSTYVGGQSVSITLYLQKMKYPF